MGLSITISVWIIKNREFVSTAAVVRANAGKIPKKSEKNETGGNHAGQNTSNRTNIAMS